MSQLMEQARMVRGFEESWTKRAMHFDRGTDHFHFMSFLRVFLRVLRVSSVHSPPQLRN